MKNLKKYIVMSTMVLMVLPSISLAATEDLDLQTCSIAVLPYNPTATSVYGDAAVPFVKDLTKSKHTDANSQADQLDGAGCHDRIPYDYEHKQDILTTDYATLTDDVDLTKKVERETHVHTYVNDNKQDDKYYYRSFIYEFEIELEADAMNNTKVVDTLQEPYNLTCTTPSSISVPELLDCNGYNANLFGGTKVSATKTGENGNNIVIRWQFGVDAQGNIRAANIGKVPARWGNNTDLNKKLGEYLLYRTGSNINPDLGNAESLYRLYDPEVNLTTKDNSKDTLNIWSATTTSRAKVINYAILKSQLNNVIGNSVNDGPKLSNFFEHFCNQYDDGTNKYWTIVQVNGQDTWRECQDYTGFTSANSAYKYMYWTSIPSTESNPDVSITSSKYLADKTVSFFYADNSNYKWKNALWIPIGSVSTIWKSPGKALPPQLACQDLSFDGPFLKRASGTTGAPVADAANPTSLKEGQEAVMKVKPTFQTGAANATKRPLEYRWFAYKTGSDKPAWALNFPTLPGNPGGLVSLFKRAFAADVLAGLFKDEITTATAGVNPFIDNIEPADPQVFYNGGQEGTIVGVQAFYADGQVVAGQGDQFTIDGQTRQRATNCHLEFKIQPQDVACTDLTLTPATLAANTPTTFTVAPQFSPAGKTVDLNYLWKADNGNFQNSSADAVGAANPFTEKVDKQTYYSGGTANTKITVMGVTKTGTQLPACSADLTIPPAGTPVCDKLTLFYKSTRAPIGELIAYPVGQPLDPAQTYIFQAGTKDTNGQTFNDKVVWNETGTGKFTKAAGSPATCPTPVDNQPFEADQNCSFVYAPPADGTAASFTAKTKSNTASRACSKQVDVLAKPPVKACLALEGSLIENGQRAETPLNQIAPDKNYSVGIQNTVSIYNDDAKTQLETYNVRLIGKGTLDITNPTVACPAPVKSGPDASGNFTYQVTNAANSCRYNYNSKAGDSLYWTTNIAPAANGNCAKRTIVPELPPVKACLALEQSIIEKGQRTETPLGQVLTDKTYTIGIKSNESIYNDDAKTPLETYNVRLIGKGTLETLSANCPAPVKSGPDVSGNFTYQVTDAPNTCKYTLQF